MIKRYYATKNNSITNSFLEGNSLRATGSNTGQADILEVFSIYGQVSSSLTGFSREKSRILLEFDVADIKSDRDAGIIPSYAKYFLKMYNASHSNTLPRNYQLEVVKLGEPCRIVTGKQYSRFFSTEPC